MTELYGFRLTRQAFFQQFEKYFQPLRNAPFRGAWPMCQPWQNGHWYTFIGPVAPRPLIRRDSAVWPFSGEVWRILPVQALRRRRRLLATGQHSMKVIEAP
jgi:hypothetical protein